MELYILRHGIAEDRSRSGRDEDRELTGEGRRKLREVLRVAASAGVKPSLVLSSPLVRAVQTAEIAAEELGYRDTIVHSRALIPDAAPAEAWNEIRTHRVENQLLLASHNPLCSVLPGYLLRSPNLAVDFKKGALMRVDFSEFGTEPNGLLRWFLVPKLADS